MAGVPRTHEPTTRRSIVGRLPAAALLLSVLTAPGGSVASDDRPKDAAPVLTGEQIIQILDSTVQWYRTLGAQQQQASEPSDLLIVFANRQAADKVVAASFQIARANAELLSSAASAATEDAKSSPTQTLEAHQRTIEEKIKSLDEQIAAERRKPSSARLEELQAERAMLAARDNLLSNMTDFENQSDPRTAGAEALKGEIDAIAASIPAESSATITAASAPAPAAPGAAAGGKASTAAAAASALAAKPATPGERAGILSLGEDVLALHRKLETIEGIDAQTAALADAYRKIGAPAFAQLKALAEQGDALSAQADQASAAELKDLRARLDTLAWFIQQSTAIVLPISQVQILLREYHHNLASWRTGTQQHYRQAWAALGVRVGILLALLGALFILGEIWRRAVLRYVQDVQRRYQLLVVRRIVLWTLALTLLGLSFVSELSSFATFAGLITAGVAVAMQSVLISVVGYFFLIGKYGIRVGDRIQIGTVTGEVLDLGLVRMHLLELNPSGALGPTGRVVGFPNLVVFQGTGGLFRQLPGVDLDWHEITLDLPAVADYAALKQRLLRAVRDAVEQFRETLSRQSRAIDSRAVAGKSHEWDPQVHMHLIEGHMQALIRYPVHGSAAADIDERVSEAVLAILNEIGGAGATAGAPPAPSAPAASG